MTQPLTFSFWKAIKTKLPDPAKFDADTIEVPVEALAPSTPDRVADFRLAVFTKKNNKWQFSHFHPPLPE